MRRATSRTAGLAVALAAVTGVTAGAATGGAPPAPRAVTLLHHGRTFDLAVGRSVSVRLPNRRRLWTRPRVTGVGAATVVPVNYYIDPGYVEWNVKASRAGRVTLTSLGRCSECRPRVRTFRVTLVLNR
jgi:hypothetical protein